MNALIQSIGSFLNLPKLTAITVPGMVIAFALVLVLGPIPCRDTSKSCPYCPDTLKPATGAQKGEQPKGLAAHFTMTAQGQTVSDPATLHLNVAAGDSATISFASTSTKGSAAIASYVWKVNDQEISTDPTCTFLFHANPTSNTIELTVTDSKGKHSNAHALVVVGPLLLSPENLTFEYGRDAKPGMQQLKLTNIGRSDLYDIRASISEVGPNWFSVEDSTCDKKPPLQPGRNCTLTVRYTPSPHGETLRPSATMTFAATLSVSAKYDRQGTNYPVQAAASLTASAESIPAPTAGETRSEKSNPIGNTVITSEATWLNKGPDSAEPEARAALLSKFEGLLPPLLLKSEPLSHLLETLPSSCGEMPLYVVPSSRPPSDKSDNTSKDGGKSKAGTPQYTGETTRSVEDVLSVADDCYASLTQIDQALQTITATMQTDIDQDTKDLQSLASSLVTAQTNANQLAERDLKGKISEKKTHLQAIQKDLKSLSQADSYVMTLIGQVTAVRKAVSGQATPAAATKETPNENIVTDVFETIQQNFLKFLLFALIVGAIFDPIQRGLLSFFGPRRDVFVAFNNVYGQAGDGEIRYGDRRLPPWTHESGEVKYLPDLVLPKNSDEASKDKTDRDKEGLRFSPADYEFRRNMNVYDQNYAIGAGFITQSEFDGIYNEFFTQCQITTGLILPLLILSVCVGIRLVCCRTVSGPGPGWWKLIAALLGPMYVGFLIGLALMVFISYLGSGALGDALRDFFTGDKGKGGKSTEGTGEVPHVSEGKSTESSNATQGKSDASDSKKQEPTKDAQEESSSGDRDQARRNRALWWIGAFLTLLSALSIWLSRDVLGWDVRPFIMLPCVFLFPLWFAGLDRLHKYYSELQARIAGNILRQQESDVQKMVDLVTHGDSLATLDKSLEQATENRGELRNFVKLWQLHRQQAIAKRQQEKPADSSKAASGGSSDTAATPSGDRGDSSKQTPGEDSR
jgi:hypothetical protein